MRAGRGSLRELFGSDTEGAGRTLAERAPMLLAGGAEMVPMYGFDNK